MLLRGWRYTAYLPHYQLGRAYYKLSREAAGGERVELCGKALASFETSIAYGAVLDSKYRRRLYRMRGQCLQEQELAEEAAP